MLSKTELKELVDEACADEVGLWFLAALIHEDHRVEELEEIREKTLVAIEELLDTKKVVAGHYRLDGSGKVDPWKLDKQQILSRISEQWKKINRMPNIGEIVVFVGAAK